MQTLTFLVAEMRELGIRSLSIELENSRNVEGDPNATLPPSSPPPAEEKAPGMCSALGCTAEKGGIFGGVGGDLCRAHALQRAGVRV